MAQSLSLSELCLALDPSFATKTVESKALCENIFDVPRSELFESYNRLREVFWTSATVSIATPPVQEKATIVVEATTPLVKRQSTDPEQPQQLRQAKRRRTDTPLIETPNHKEMLSSGVSSSLLTLWGIKRALIQQLRCNLSSYNEAKVATVINECEQLCNDTQRRHLAEYMKPVMHAMRRHQRYATIEEALQRWQEQ